MNEKISQTVQSLSPSSQNRNKPLVKAEANNHQAGSSVGIAGKVYPLLAVVGLMIYFFPFYDELYTASPIGLEQTILWGVYFISTMVSLLAVVFYYLAAKTSPVSPVFPALGIPVILLGLYLVPNLNLVVLVVLLIQALREKYYRKRRLFSASQPAAANRGDDKIEPTTRVSSDSSIFSKRNVLFGLAGAAALLHLVFPMVFIDFGLAPLLALLGFAPLIISLGDLRTVTKNESTKNERLRAYVLLGISIIILLVLSELIFFVFDFYLLSALNG